MSGSAVWAAGPRPASSPRAGSSLLPAVLCQIVLWLQTSVCVFLRVDHGGCLLDVLHRRCAFYASIVARTQSWLLVLADSAPAPCPSGLFAFVWYTCFVFTAGELICCFLIPPELLSSHHFLLALLAVLCGVLCVGASLLAALFPVRACPLLSGNPSDTVLLYRSQFRAQLASSSADAPSTDRDDDL